MKCKRGVFNINCLFLRVRVGWWGGVLMITLTNSFSFILLKGEISLVFKTVNSVANSKSLEFLSKFNFYALSM